MQYPTLDICRQLLFPLIRANMTTLEPAPVYEEQVQGLEKLRSTFALAAWDTYPDLLSKSAYIFCSIIDGHPFSNGNKRLAVAALTYVLVVNGEHISAPSMKAVQQELVRFFPALTWEDVSSFKHPHEYFFYHLALIIADRKQKGQMTFQQEQAAVRELLTFITAR